MTKNYNYKKLMKENPDLYESVYFKIANILKKYNALAYRNFTYYLASNLQDTHYRNKVEKALFDLYISSLSRDDLKELKFLTEKIDRLIKHLEFEFLVTFSETGAIDIPPMQNNQTVIDDATKVILRDDEGFYSDNKHIQKQIDNQSAVFTTLNSYLLNKEKIMSGNRNNHSKKFLTRKDLLIVSTFLGYGSVREEVLNEQSRNKKNLEKSKGQK